MLGFAGSVFTARLLAGLLSPLNRSRTPSRATAANAGEASCSSVKPKTVVYNFTATGTSSIMYRTLTSDISDSPFAIQLTSDESGPSG